MPKKYKKKTKVSNKKKNSSTVDAILYTSTALFIFTQGYFTGDDAYKYVNPYVLFWLKYIIGGLAASSAALKMYRSTSFAESR